MDYNSKLNHRVYPAYMDQFRCAAGNCSDTCCQNWTIDIDPISAGIYKKHEGALAKRFAECIYKDKDGTHFRLRPDGTCPFLNQEGLCDIYKTLGEQALCDICQEHPRFYNVRENVVEMGVGLCCEAAARLILGNEYPDDLIEEGAPADPATQPWLEAQQKVLQNAKAQLRPAPADKESFGEMVDDYCEDVIHEDWKVWLQQAKANFGKIKKQIHPFLTAHPEVQEQLTRVGRYLFYRMFLGEEDDVLVNYYIEYCKLWTCEQLALILYLDIDRWMTTGQFTLEDQINICKRYSQEVEYAVSEQEIL